MPWFLRLTWFGYCLLFASSSSGTLASLLNEQGQLFCYYQMLLALSPGAIFAYCCAICASIMNIISLWPLLCHTLDIPSSGKNALKLLLLLRIVLEIPAHNFEWQEFKALQHTNPGVATGILFFSLLLLLPSYSAFLQQAMGKRTRNDQ
jgi:hypothetical protein